MKHSPKWIWVAVATGFAFTFFPASLFAGTPVVFGAEDLAAFVRLAKPEASSLRIDGRTGEFRPGPSLRFAGLEAQSFDIDLKLGADLVDLRFDSLVAGAPRATFERGRIRLDLAFADREKAIRSAVGSISLKGVSITAWIRFAPGGELAFDSAALNGELRGSGLLKPKWVIEALKKSALKTLRNQIELQLGRPGVRDSLEQGLVTWARFSADPRFTRVTPGTTSVSESGIRYEAE